MKDHRRLICDTAALMRASYFDVIHCAIAYDKVEGDSAVVRDEANTLLNHFIDTNGVPEYIESFCLDVLMGNIPIKNDKGKVINAPQSKR